MSKKPFVTKSKKSLKTINQKRSWLQYLLAILIVIMLGCWAMYVSVFAPTTADAKTLVVDKGDTYHSLLVNKRQAPPLIEPLQPLITRLYLTLSSPKPLQAGVYQIPKGASLHKTVAILEQGAEVAMVKVQIIEGKSVKDLYHLLKTTDGVTLETLTPSTEVYTWADVAVDNQAVADKLGIQTANGNLEGWFAPDTYYFAKGVTDTAILKQLYERQRNILDTAWKNKDLNLPYQSANEMLIMASIVEKETGIASERNKVSAVFVNRLHQGMRLQTDPTIIYGLFDRYDGTIYRSNIDEKTAYNTYQIDGLPPTPIALPSAAAIDAAAHPDSTDVLYFVATGTGGHTFSRTLAEHNQAVAAYRKVVLGK